MSIVNCSFIPEAKREDIEELLEPFAGAALLKFENGNATISVPDGKESVFIEYVEDDPIGKSAWL